MKKLRLWLGIMGSAVLLGLSPLTVKADSAGYNAGTNTVDGSFSDGKTGNWQITFNTGEVISSSDFLNGESSFSVSVPVGATSATVLMDRIEGGGSTHQIAIGQPTPPAPTPQENPTPQEEPQEEPAPVPQEEPTPDTVQPGTDSSQTQPDSNQSNQADGERQQEILDNERKKEEEARQKDREVSALAGLTVEGGELSPAFDPATTEYTVTVPEVEKVTIQAVTAVQGQTVSGDGEVVLNKKDQDIEVTVTSADGAQTTKYLLHIRIKTVEKKETDTTKKEITVSKPKSEEPKEKQGEKKQEQAKTAEPTKKGSKVLTIALAVGAAVLIAGGIGGYFFLLKKGILEP
ncbi:MAG: cadherin-like beta sandwich domain-containing protein [Eubacteriales bacterium]|nr:cadherin-like beta sandwich domain-containing protein [Eubacteriales bacterium]